MRVKAERWSVVEVFWPSEHGSAGTARTGPLLNLL